MKKMSTLYIVEYTGKEYKQVLPYVRLENTWVFTGVVKATRKYDGTSCMIKDMILYRRYDAKRGKVIPENAIPCCPPDTITGHHPHWILCDRSKPQDKYHFEAFDLEPDLEDGTYELCGEKVQGNPERIVGHELIKHGSDILMISDWSFKGFENFLSNSDIEGIVFHELVSPYRMCKLRKSDYGMKRRINK